MGRTDGMQGDDGVKIRMIVVALLASLLVVVTPVAGGSTPSRTAAAPPAITKAPSLWHADFGTGADGYALDPATNRVFVRQGATPDGANLQVGAPETHYDPITLTGSYGHPVAADGAIFVFRDEKLRRIDPTSLVETQSWTVPGLTASLFMTSVDGDLVWVTRSSSPSPHEQLYRFDPATGTTTTSDETTVGYSGPLGGGSALVGYRPMPGQLVAFAGAQPGAPVPTDIDHIGSIDVSDDGSLVTALDVADHEAVEYSLPGLVPTGTVYAVDGTPAIAASTTESGGALAIVSKRADSNRYDLRVYARGVAEPVVAIDLPPVGRSPEAGDLVFSADGTQLFLLVRDQAATLPVTRVVEANLAGAIASGPTPDVVGSRGGAKVQLSARVAFGGEFSLDGTPVPADIYPGFGFDYQGAPPDQATLTVPAMSVGTKALVLTNPLGIETTLPPIRVVDLGPFTTSPWFVRVQISDITGKRATPQQIEAAIEKLATTGSAGGFIAGLQTQRGQATTSAALIRLYRAVFLRPPDTGGYTYWLGRMRDGTRLAQVAATFSASKEFERRYGSLPDPDFVDRIYVNVLGRHAEPKGRAYWIARLRAGTSRGALVAQFAQSGEFVTKSTVDVQRIELRLAMLDKSPTEAQLAPLRSLPLGEVARQFLADPTYELK